MNASQRKDAEEAHAALQTFLGQLGPNDAYKEMLLDVILEIIYEKENQTGNDLHLLDEKEQKGVEAPVQGGVWQMPPNETG